MFNLSIEQRFRTYTGTMQQITDAINADLITNDLWTIKTMSVVTSGQGVYALVLAEKQSIQQ